MVILTNAMSEIVTIDDAGRIVLPKSLREKFRLQGGDKLSLETVGDHMELKPLEKAEEQAVIKKGGLLVVAASGEPCDAADAVRVEREERRGGTLSGH